MSRKKELMVHLNSQEEFDAFLAADGLKVVDVHTDWCGPCQPAKSLFKMVKIEIADDLLMIATANASKIESLGQYDGTSKPRFLFYGKNVLVNMVYGLDGPAIRRVIEEELQNEHDAIDGTIERTPFDPKTQRPASSRPASNRPRSGGKSASRRASSAKSAAAPEPPKEKSYTFAIIKPKAVEAGHADEIFAALAEAGLKAVQQDELTMTLDQAKEFYKEHDGKPFFEGLVEYMASGPCKPLVLSSEGDAVSQWRDLIGPTNPETAREEAPESLRGRFATELPDNALHGSDSTNSAIREIEFFFQDWANENLPKEETVLVITPDAVEKKAEIIEAISAAGYTVGTEKEETLVEDQVNDMFGDASDDLRAHLTSAPSIVLLVSRLRLFELIPDLIGVGSLEEVKETAPESLRAKFGADEVKIGVWYPGTASDTLTTLFMDDPDTLEVVDPNLQDDPSKPKKPSAGEDDDGDGDGDGDDAEGDAGTEETPKQEDTAEAGEGTANPDENSEGNAEKEGEDQGKEEGKEEAKEGEQEQEDAPTNTSDSTADNEKGDSADNAEQQEAGDATTATSSDSATAPSDNSDKADDAADDAADADGDADNATAEPETKAEQGSDATEEAEAEAEGAADKSANADDNKPEGSTE